MACTMCSVSGKKMVKCSAVGDICMRCCFLISSGNTELLKKLKDVKYFSKSDILKICSECKQELEK